MNGWTHVARGVEQTLAGALVAVFAAACGGASHGEPLVIDVPDSGCSIPTANVSGSVATYVPGPLCRSGPIVSLTTDEGTFTLRPGDQTADLSISETFMYPTTTCHQTTQGIYQKQ